MLIVSETKKKPCVIKQSISDKVYEKNIWIIAITISVALIGLILIILGTNVSYYIVGFIILVPGVFFILRAFGFGVKKKNIC